MSFTENSVLQHAYIQICILHIHMLSALCTASFQSTWIYEDYYSKYEMKMLWINEDTHELSRLSFLATILSSFFSQQTSFVVFQWIILAAAYAILFMKSGRNRRVCNTKNSNGMKNKVRWCGGAFCLGADSLCSPTLEVGTHSCCFTRTYPNFFVWNWIRVILVRTQVLEQF